MAIQIISPGLLSTIQDYGRLGYQYAGISQSGVMDQEAYFDALGLVSSDASLSQISLGNICDAVIEATMFGPTIQFLDDTYFAITGADMQPTLDGKAIAMYETLFASKGQTLSMQMAVNGCRAYIAFAGGIDVPIVMGSRSTNMKCQLGGFCGRSLKASDIIPTGTRSVSIKKITKKTYDAKVVLRLIEGPQENYFTKKAFETLYTKTYTVSDLCDRMGYRLEGPALESLHGVDIISDGITMGSVQIPPNGKPIILLADRQTTGGYAKIGSIYSKDIPKLVQLKPGETITFERMDIHGL